LKNLRLRFGKALSAIMLALMEKLAIFKSGFQMQSIAVNTGLRGGNKLGPGGRCSLVAMQGLAIRAEHGELTALIHEGGFLGVAFAVG